ncbi:MAG: phosphoribosyltransferase family protein [Candidatus Cyclobacteriaceae bacterium M2_1C_046]
MAATVEKSHVLTHQQVEQKIRRIAFEIYENNFQEKKIVLAGIFDKGYQLAELIQKQLDQLTEAKIELLKIDLDKLAPTQSEIKLDKDVEGFKKTVIILIDDVLNTGRTLAYSLRPFLKISVKKIEVAVLVNRSLTQFPISCKYTGYELSTTIDDHVEVILDGKEMGVFLH